MAEINDEVYDLMNTQLYHCINAAYNLTAFNERFDEYLLGDNLTPEDKRTLKENKGFSSEIMKRLGRAADAFKVLDRNLEEILAKFEGNQPPETYDIRRRDTIELMSIEFLYIAKTMNNPKAASDIKEFMLNYGGGTDPMVKKVFRHWQRSMKKL